MSQKHPARCILCGKSPGVVTRTLAVHQLKKQWTLSIEVIAEHKQCGGSLQPACGAPPPPLSYGLDMRKYYAARNTINIANTSGSP